MVGPKDRSTGSRSSRIALKAPFPLLRHHFGLPTLAATTKGIAQIAEAHVLDIISLGIDQDAQENFFHPALTILNAGRIECIGGEFQFYLDGVTPNE